jgi:hypothetical protein
MRAAPWVAICVNLGLVGCIVGQPNLEANAPKDDAQCKAMGYQPGTDGYLQCRQLFINQHVADAQARASAANDIGASLQRAGAVTQTISPPPPPPLPTRTTCSPTWGGGMSCMTY